MKYLLLSLIIFTLTVTNNAQSQVLIVNASVQAGHLSDDVQDQLQDLDMKIEQYYNGYNWIEDEFEYDVPANIKVIIQTVKDKTFEKVFSAQFLISTASGENFYDKGWEFPYTKATSLSHFKSDFDPLTHFLDFYAYMVLAGELDTNGLLLGNSLYNNAADIANQGLMSQYPTGWSNRLEKVQMITHAYTRPLREVKPDFFEALFLMEDGNDEKAYKVGKKVLEGLAQTYKNQPNNFYLQLFFKSHYNELANIFDGHNKELERLVRYDNKHRETYRDHMK